MKNKFIAIVLSLVALLGVQRANAWALWGHHLIAYVAEQHLTPEAKSNCEHYLKHKVTHYSLWQDYWRNSDPFKEITHWHMNYVDKDFNTVGKKGDITRDAVTQIERIVKEMEKGKYKQMSDSMVMVNLKLLIHMVGDMHTPCHVGYAKESGYKISSLIVNGKKYNHHKFWDAAPQVMHPKWNADKYLKACDTYSPKQIKKIVKGNPTKWGKQNAYKMVKTFYLWEKGTDIKDLTVEQRKQIDDVMFEQIAYAGYRLAAILNKIMSK